MSRPKRRASWAKDLDVWKVGVFVDETPDDCGLWPRPSPDSTSRRSMAPCPQAFAKPAALARGSRSRLGRDSGSDVARSEGDLPRRRANGVPFDWRMSSASLESRRSSSPGGLDASNVGEAIRIAQPWGVDASSASRNRPGIKDHDKVRQFICGRAAEQFMTTSQPDSDRAFRSVRRDDSCRKC